MPDGEHTSAITLEVLTDVVEQNGLNLETDICGLTADNAAVMKRMLKDSKVPVPVGCFDHGLQLVVKVLLQDPTASGIITAATNLGRRIKKSPAAKKDLKDEQKRLSHQELLPKSVRGVMWLALRLTTCVQMSEIRWNSSEDMLARCIQMNAEIVGVFTRDEDINACADLHVVTALHTVLNVFIVGQRIIEAEKLITSSFILPVLTNIHA
jgi:hypothetical protein